MNNRYPSSLMCALIAAAAVAAATPSPARAAAETQVITSHETFEVHENGDATARLRMKFTAAHYLQWKQAYGTNPSLLKREVAKQNSQYEACDFKLQQNDLEREIDLSYTGKGLVRHTGGGWYELRLPREWRGGTRVGTSFEFYYPETVGPNAICQHAIRLSLPPRAVEFSEQTSERGQRVIRYRLPAAGGLGGWAVGAVASLALGVLCGVLAVAGGRGR